MKGKVFKKEQDKGTMPLCDENHKELAFKSNSYYYYYYLFILLLEQKLPMKLLLV